MPTKLLKINFSMYELRAIQVGVDQFKVKNTDIKLS